MQQEKKYAAVKKLLEAGGIDHLADIFVFIPKTNVYKLLSLGYITLLEKLKNPGLFSINELKILSDLIGVDYKAIHDLAKKDADELQKKKRKSDKK